MIAFDPAADLPEGTTLLEASAGTGKTHNIASLAVRYLAQGRVDVDRLMVVSFSRAASGELRTRVRTRLQSTIAVLDQVAGGAPIPDTADDTDRVLCAGPAEEVQPRLRRLRRALSDFDRAGIMTIHQFCQAMFDELGVLATQDPSATLVDNLSPLVDEIVADLYLARYATASPRPFDLVTATAIAQACAVDFPASTLTPASTQGPAAERLAFAAEVRSEFDRRKRHLGVYSYDDQLRRLYESLQGPAGQAGIRRLRRRCAVVLVDEFQDTDLVQWEILNQTFAGHVPLVLIGDPKQAIYSFRGADVTSYHQAALAATDRYFLTTNYRSDGPVVDAITALFAGASLGSGIQVEKVQAAHLGSRLAGPHAPPPVSLRYVAADHPLPAATARTAIHRDLVTQVVGLLSGGTSVTDGDTVRPVEARDIAVLVTTNRRGRELAAALANADVPVAFSGSDSIFSSEAAQDWLVLLRALIEPGRRRNREAILTDFVGADLDALALASDSQLNGWSARLHRWAQLLTRHGVAALFAAITADPGDDQRGLAERLLARPRGERILTDHYQLAEILHAEYTDGTHGPALVSWLADQIEHGDRASDRTRRLETDRKAVHVMTIHKAKGMQFPIVLLPHMADLYVSSEDSGAAIDFHDPDGVRMLDIGGKEAPGRAGRRALAQTERAEDQLRALYVAATRAQSQLTMWWAPTPRNTEASALHRVLYRDRSRPGAPEAAYPIDKKAPIRTPDRLDWLAGAGIVCLPCSTGPIPVLAHRRDRLEELIAPAFSASIDPVWRRTSYSGLTQGAHDAAHLIAENAVLDDEPVDTSDDGDPAAGAPSPMADLPAGAAFGSLVHEIFEHLDWHASDEELDKRLKVAVRDAATHFAVGDVRHDALAAALKPSLLTPLGPLTDNRALADFEISDRLSELSFEFALGTEHTRTTLHTVAELLRRWLPADDPLVDYPDDLEDPALADQVLRGFLTGSIDSVLRVHGPQGPRFVVVDYKTNRLGPADLRLAHFTQDAMTTQMRHTHYPLQALLYCVAIHRFLHARLADYDPKRHLGGVGYLFVRGLGGAEASAETGVFAWYPPSGLICALSDLLADRSNDD